MKTLALVLISVSILSGCLIISNISGLDNAINITQIFTCDNNQDTIFLSYKDTLMEDEKYLKYDFFLTTEGINHTVFLSKKKQAIYVTGDFSPWNSGIKLKRRTWKIIDYNLEAKEYVDLSFPFHDLNILKGYHLIEQKSFDKALQDTIYKISLPNFSNAYFSSYEFSKKYGYLEFEHHNRKQKYTNGYANVYVDTTLCTCNSLQKIPFFDE